MGENEEKRGGVRRALPFSFSTPPTGSPAVSSPPRAPPFLLHRPSFLPVYFERCRRRLRFRRRMRFLRHWSFFFFFLTKEVESVESGEFAFFFPSHRSSSREKGEKSDAMNPEHARNPSLFFLHASLGGEHM